MKATNQQNDFLRRGDTVQLQGTVGVVFKVAEGSTSCYDLLHPSKVHHISETVPRSLILQRNGEDGLKEFMTKHKLGKQTTNNPEPEDDMKKYTTPEEAKAAKKAADKARYAAKKAGKSPAAKAAAFIAKDKPVEAKPEVKPKSAKPTGTDEARSRGKCGALFGHSVVAVMKTAGKAGATYEQAQKVLEAHNITAAAGTVKRNLRLGVNGVKGPELTKAQLSEFGV